MMYPWKKLNTRRGESMGEVLVALLVGALAILMLAGAIGSAQHMILRNGDVMDEYYRQNNLLEQRQTADGALAPSMKLRLREKNTGRQIGGDITVSYYVHEQGGTEIVSYAPAEEGRP